MHVLYFVLHIPFPPSSAGDNTQPVPLQSEELQEPAATISANVSAKQDPQTQEGSTSGTPSTNTREEL